MPLTRTVLLKAVGDASLQAHCEGVDSNAVPAHVTTQDYPGICTVRWGLTKQEIDGFGGYSDPWSSMNYAGAALLDRFFSPTSGIGVSLVRTLVHSDRTQWGVYQENRPDYLAGAIARGAKVWASPWSPPWAWKSTGQQDGGTLLSSHYQDFATYLADYVETLAGLGVPHYAISVQNEPDVTGVGYDTCVWSGDQMRTFIRDYLGPTFASRCPTVKIMMPEEGKWTFSRADTVLNDSAAAARVGIVAAHAYWGDGRYAPYPKAAQTGKRLWETEVATLGQGVPPDYTMTGAMPWALQLHYALTNASCNAWHYFLLAQTDYISDEGLLVTTRSAPPSGPRVFTDTKRFYVFGNFSRYIRPGYWRIDATANPLAGVYTSAYRDAAASKLVIVAINTTTTRQALTVASVAGTPDFTLDAYETSAARNLERVAQGLLLLSGGAFSIGLPAQSVTTLVTTAPSPDSTRPHEPVGMTPLAECRFEDNPATAPLAQVPYSTIGMVRGCRALFADLRGEIVLASDATAPTSPSAIWKQPYWPGMDVGDNPGPIVMWQQGYYEGAVMPYRRVYVKLVLNLWGQGTGDFEMMHGGLGSLLKLFYLPTGDSNQSRNTLGWQGIDGDGGVALTSSRPFTLLTRYWGDDGEPLGPGSTPLDYCTQTSFAATAWHTLEVLFTANTLPAGGSDPAPADGKFELWVNGVKQSWYCLQTDSIVGETITGLRVRTYKYPRGVWRYHQDSVFGGGQAGVRSRYDYILWDHVYLSGGE